MKIAIISDVFPPKCGGSGWSSYFLAQALVQKGHAVQVVVPKEGKSFSTANRHYEGLPITEYIYPAAHIPFVRNYTRNERLYPRFAAWLQEYFSLNQIEVAHAQHYLTIPPTVMAAQKSAVVSLGTVRDYWATCYWTTRLNGQHVCPQCTVLNRVKCLVGNQGAVGAIAAPVSLYMAANLHLKQRWLAQADAVLAVSHYIRGQLAPFVSSNRLHVIPNFIDIAELDDISRQNPIIPQAAQLYLLYAGKLEENKGARLLLEVLRQGRPAIPTLIAGEGALAQEMKQTIERENLNAHMLGWVDHDEVLRLMAHAEVLLFPSLWHEPLSRVLLEAAALGTLVCAINTGGTPDIIEDGVNGVLAANATEMATKLRNLLEPAQVITRSQMRQAIRQTVEQKFSQSVVVEQVEQLYLTLLERKKVIKRH